jgi:methylmalonyl-CoA mutase C-terminal domain/subunit
MNQGLVKILIAKFGQGYEPAMFKLGEAFSQAGFEVIYTSIQDPQAIVSTAVHKAVDYLGITTVPGADIEEFATIFELLAKQKQSQIKVTAGGFLEPEDIRRIKEMGVVEFFPKGTTYAELIEWVQTQSVNKAGQA